MSNQSPKHINELELQNIQDYQSLRPESPDLSQTQNFVGVEHVYISHACQIFGYNRLTRAYMAKSVYTCIYVFSIRNNIRLKIRCFVFVILKLYFLYK